MTTIGTLYIALELSCDKWLLACATQAAQKPRFRSVPARDLTRLGEEIAKAKARFQLPADAPVCTCYEAGRDGFWLHRALTSLGIVKVVVDSSSIEVNRRHKHVKSDPVDARKLLNLLCRYHGGERKVWSVVNVPTVADEDRRQLHRGLREQKGDAAHSGGGFSSRRPGFTSSRAYGKCQRRRSATAGTGTRPGLPSRCAARRPPLC